MSAIHYNEQDLHLFALVLVLMRPMVATLIAVYAFVISFVIFESLATAAISALLATTFILGLVYLLTRRRIRKVWRVQAPDGIIKVRISQKGWQVATNSVSSSYEWAIFAKRYELFGCYVLKLSAGIGAIVYRKDYFSPEEQRLIEAHTRKANIWLR